MLVCGSHYHRDQRFAKGHVGCICFKLSLRVCNTSALEICIMDGPMKLMDGPMKLMDMLGGFVLVQVGHRWHLGPSGTRSSETWQRKASRKKTESRLLAF